MASKTIAARILDDSGVGYDLVEYDLGDAEFSAEAVAGVVALPVEQVFKTLVAVGDRTGPMFAIVPGGTRLDMKRLAAATGNRRVELAPLAEVAALTGYPRGAVTVMGAKRPFPAVIDETAELHDRIGVSGGAHGVELVVRPDDYIRVTAAQVADIAR
jgi:Cys-tRNA(Pro)/Cys-tRNA(Cys) deacylase